ncbi:MAG: MoaD/ThiS family protein [Alphaproteobacteria bacterium]|jgi:sulfur carrier protein ThiS
MKVMVELIAMGRDGEVAIEVNDEATADSLLDVLGLRNVETYMSMINDQQVAPGDRAARRLVEGDRIKFFPPLEGG